MGADYQLVPEPLTKQVFAPFGDVIETDGARQMPINQGTTMRYHDLAALDLVGEGGQPLVNIFRGQPRPKPIILEVMERHPLGSQAFYPLQDRPWFVVVAEADADPLQPDALRAFWASGQQGINYHANIWHHPLLVIESDSDFLVIDRGGPGKNLEERFFDKAELRISLLQN